MDNVKDRLFAVMVDVFQVDKSEINNETSPETTTEWDSLKHMLLLVAIEEEFEFRLTDDEMTQCISSESILDVINNKE
jgi:acyl carrier protein